MMFVKTLYIRKNCFNIEGGLVGRKLVGRKLFLVFSLKGYGSKVLCNFQNNWEKQNYGKIEIGRYLANTSLRQNQLLFSCRK